MLISEKGNKIIRRLLRTETHSFHFLIILIAVVALGVFCPAGEQVYPGRQQAIRPEAVWMQQNNIIVQALEKQPPVRRATYNLGNALYNQQKLDESIASYDAIASTTSDPSIRSKAYHNMGNALPGEEGL